MARQQADDEELDNDLDGLENDSELDSFLETMTTQDEEQKATITARKKIEDLLEEKRLRSLLDDYYEDDEQDIDE